MSRLRIEISTVKNGAVKLGLYMLKVRELGAVASFFVLLAVFTYINPRFLSADSLSSIVTLASELGSIVLGMAFVMIAGEFDLSVGSVYAASGMLSAHIINTTPLPPEISAVLGIAAAIAFGAGVGLLNATIVTRARIPSFICTLGVMWLLRGFIYAFSRGFPVSIAVAPPPPLAIFSSPLAYGIRTSALWFIALIIVLHYILNNTRLGIHIQSVGGAPDTSRAVGINVVKIKYIGFIVSGVLASIAGLMGLARFRTIEAVAGVGYELESIAASVIGGTSLTGGIGSIIGAALGSVIIAQIRLGLVVAGAPAYWYIGFVGLILPIVGTINIRFFRRVYGV